MKNDTVRIGIIGAGANTRRMHIPGFQRISGVEIVLVCNRSEASSRHVAEAFGIPAVAGHWREVVDSPDVDAVCIGTWPYLHAEASIAALDAGKHVLTEARMAMNLDEASAMLDAARRHPDRVAQVVPAPMSLDFDATILELLDAGAIGDLREVCVVQTGGQSADSSAPITWRQDVDLSGHNVLTMGIYHEMVQRWLRREPEWVLADGAVFTPVRKTPDGTEEKSVHIPESLSILGAWPGGVRLVYHFSGVEPGRPRNEIRLNGSRGALRLDLGESVLHRADLEQENPVEVPAEKRRGWRVEEDFIRSVREGVPVHLTSFEDGVKYMRFTDNVHRSLESDRARVVWDV